MKLALTAALALALAPAAAAAVVGNADGRRTAPKPALTLQLGSHGPRVAALQWLLGGHPPNVFTAVKGSFPWKPTGIFGPRTAAALYAYKYRLGYPAAENSKRRPIAGPRLFALLEGKTRRPAYWVALAAKRLRAIEAAQPTKLALAIDRYETSQLGVSEQPPGSNDGPQVRVYQADTGAYGAAWCLSFQQHSFRVGGYGHFANDTASVYYAVDFFAARNLLHAKPRVGALVLFVDYNRWGRRIPGTGHAGYVVKVGAGWYVSIEGNQANGVHEIFHRLGDRGNVFAYIPRVA